MAHPVVVFRRAVTLHAARGPAYRTTRRSIERAPTFSEAVAALEHAVRSGELGLAIDFAPTADYARKFVNTTGLHLASMGHPGDRHLGERAVRALAALLLGITPRGRRPAGTPTSDTRRTVAEAYAKWHRIVLAAWNADEFVSAVHRAGTVQLDWTVTHRRDLAALRRRPVARPSDLAAHLTAWQLKMPLRRIRAARTRLSDVVSA